MNASIDQNMEHIHLIELICLHIYIIHYYSFWIISSINIQFIFLNNSIALLVDDNRNLCFICCLFCLVRTQIQHRCDSKSICIVFLISYIIPVPVKMSFPVHHANVLIPHCSGWQKSTGIFSKMCSKWPTFCGMLLGNAFSAWQFFFQFTWLSCCISLPDVAKNTVPSFCSYFNM